MDKSKDGKGKDGETQDGKGKAKVKDDKEKTDPKSNANKDKKCFYFDKIGHVKADCRRSQHLVCPTTHCPVSVSDDEFHSPMMIFALKAGSPTDRVMVASGAAHCVCPSDDANEHEVQHSRVRHQRSCWIGCSSQ